MYCPKGPWLPWEDEEAIRVFSEGMLTVAASLSVHTLRIEPEVREQHTRVKELLQTLGFRKFRCDLNFKTTMIVDLSSSEEDLLANMNRNRS